MDNKELYKSFNSSEQESYNNGWTYIYEGDDVFPEDAQLLLDSYTQESVEFHLIHPTALVSLNDVSREEVAEIVNMHYSDKTSLINAIVGLMGRAARKN